MIQQQRDGLAKEAMDKARKITEAREEAERVDQSTRLLQEIKNREEKENRAESYYREFDNTLEAAFNKLARNQNGTGKTLPKLRDLDFYLHGGYNFFPEVSVRAQGEVCESS